MACRDQSNIGHGTLFWIARHQLRRKGRRDAGHRTHQPRRRHNLQGRQRNSPQWPVRWRNICALRTGFGFATDVRDLGLRAARGCRLQFEARGGKSGNSHPPRAGEAGSCQGVPFVPDVSIDRWPDHAFPSHARAQKIPETRQRVYSITSCGTPGAAIPKPKRSSTRSCTPTATQFSQTTRAFGRRAAELGRLLRNLARFQLEAMSNAIGSREI